MKIQVRHLSTTKAAITYEVFADGYRIGFLKLRANKLWQVTDWIHRYVGAFRNRNFARKGLTEYYRTFREECTSAQAKAFEKHAIRCK